MKYVMMMEEVCDACALYVAKKINHTGEFDVSVSIFGEMQDNKIKSISVEVEDGEKK